MIANELAGLDGVAHAALMRANEITPQEAIEAAAERLDRVNGAINAVVTPTVDGALRDATSAGSVHTACGVPILLKDFSAQQAGVRYAAGNVVLKESGWRSDVDSFLVQRLRVRGFYSLGRTNTPEFAAAPFTEPRAFGATRNPWNLSRSAGGSSGGSAAAVAAGIVPVAHGNDGGGSLRMPAAACGVVGLKPSRGRISMGPHPAERAALAVTEGFLTRTVRDTATMLDAVNGRMPGDPSSALKPFGRYIDLLGAPVPALRIRVLVDAFNEATVDPECLAAVAQTATTLEELGHQVAACESSPIAEPVLATHASLRAAVMSAATMSSWEAALGRPLTENDVEPATWESAQVGRDVTADRYAHAITDAWRLARRIHEWWTDFDLLLTPTAAQVADRVAGTSGSLRELAERARPWRAFTPPFNLTGQPAVSLPLGWSREGLPIGVQLVAASGREDHLISIAHSLEAAMPWSHRRPVIWAGN